MNGASRRKLFLNLFLVGFFLLAVVTGLAIRARAASPKAATPARENSIRAKLIGSWRLVSRETYRANGELLVDPSLSATPAGFLVYDASGHVAAQLSRRGRTLEMLAEECKIAASTKGTPNTAQTILGYDVYFGTFTLHEQEGFVTHHLESALFPADIGKDINRNFKLSGDRLTLSFDTTTQDGAPITPHPNLGTAEIVYKNELGSCTKPPCLCSAVDLTKRCSQPRPSVCRDFPVS